MTIIWEAFEGVLGLRFLVEAETEEQALNKIFDHICAENKRTGLTFNAFYITETIKLKGTDPNRGFGFIRPANIIR